MISDSQSPEKLHKNESIKSTSEFLRGTILEGLSDSITGTMSADDQQLTKFHGIYQQDNRDHRAERRRKKLDKAYTFMARICLPNTGQENEEKIISILSLKFPDVILNWKYLLNVFHATDFKNVQSIEEDGHLLVKKAIFKQGETNLKGIFANANPVYAIKHTIDRQSDSSTYLT